MCGVISLALWPQVVSQAPQHFRSSETQTTCDGCFSGHFISLRYVQSEHYTHKSVCSATVCSVTVRSDTVRSVTVRSVTVRSVTVRSVTVCSVTVRSVTVCSVTVR